MQLSHGGLVVALYVVTICGALLFSGYRHIAIFGVANLAAVVVLARLTLDGFTSLWCAYAAIAAARSPSTCATPSRTVRRPICSPDGTHNPTVATATAGSRSSSSVRSAAAVSSWRQGRSPSSPLAGTSAEAAESS